MKIMNIMVLKIALVALDIARNGHRGLLCGVNQQIEITTIGKNMFTGIVEKLGVSQMIK